MCYSYVSWKIFLCQVLQLQGIAAAGNELRLVGQGVSWWAQPGATEAIKCCGFRQGDDIFWPLQLKLERHQPCGVEKERVQVLCMDGPMKWWFRAAPFNFWQQALNLLNGHQDLMRETNKCKMTFHQRISYCDPSQAIWSLTTKPVQHIHNVFFGFTNFKNWNLIK